MSIMPVLRAVACFGHLTCSGTCKLLSASCSGLAPGRLRMLHCRTRPPCGRFCAGPQRTVDRRHARIQANGRLTICSKSGSFVCLRRCVFTRSLQQSLSCWSPAHQRTPIYRAQSALSSRRHVAHSDQLHQVAWKLAPAKMDWARSSLTRIFICKSIVLVGGQSCFPLRFGDGFLGVNACRTSQIGGYCPPCRLAQRSAIIAARQPAPGAGLRRAGD